MFTSSFSISEQEHRQWKPYKHGRAIGFAEHYVCHAVQRSASTRPGIYAPALLIQVRGRRRDPPRLCCDHLESRDL
jgi:hypothetical protein